MRVFVCRFGTKPSEALTGKKGEIISNELNLTQHFLLLNQRTRNGLRVKTSLVGLTSNLNMNIVELPPRNKYLRGRP